MTLTVTSNQFAADTLVNMLELEGIKTMVRSADMLTHMNGGLSQRMAVFVMPSDFEAAKAILDASEIEPED